jgi:hypothetical protein
MMKPCLLPLLLWPIAGFASQPSVNVSRLEAHIVDYASGKPQAARVAATDLDGKFLEIGGQHPHVQYLGKRWCYVDGRFSLPLPAAGAVIEIRRGLETRPELATVPGNKSGTIHKTFRLRRWIDMGQHGYMSGDIHAHLPVPSEAHFQMAAEDLHALALLYLPDRENPLPINDCFTGLLDTNSTPGREIYVGQEIQDWQMGHLTLLGLSKLVPGYPGFGGTMEYWRGAPNWDLVRAMRATREQKGMVVWSHFCSLPGAQSPVGIALGLVDAIELLTWNDPVQFPNHWSPWENSGMPQPEFPVMRPMDLYYQFLNAGFHLPIAAGTDKFYEEIPLGSNRTYVQAREPGDYAAWLDGIKSGRTFVSNGPILEFEADGQVPGDVVEFQGARQIKARVRARSILPFTTLDIVLNGKTIRHKTVAIPANTPADGLYSMEIETTVELSRSSWLAARVVDHPDLRNRILPRDVSVFAHTSPVYFMRDGRKVREAASIVYLRKWTEGLLHWLGTDPPFSNETDRINARLAAEQALRFYRDL